MRHIHCRISPRSAPEWSWLRVKISHITMGFVISPASERIIWGLGPQLCSIWISIRSKIILSEAGVTTKSMVMWLILTRIGMTILELIWGRFCNEYAAWCCINLFRSLKRLLYYHWMKKDPLWSNLTLQSDCTAWNPCTGYPTYHSQIARSGPKLE